MVVKFKLEILHFYIMISKSPVFLLPDGLGDGD